MARFPTVWEKVRESSKWKQFDERYWQVLRIRRSKQTQPNRCNSPIIVVRLILRIFACYFVFTVAIE